MSKPGLDASVTYRRVMLKISGEALMGDQGFGLHPPTVQRIAAEVIVLDGGLNLSITASFGVTACREGDDSASLLARADALLYEAKQAGRNRVASSA